LLTKKRRVRRFDSLELADAAQLRRLVGEMYGEKPSCEAGQSGAIL